MNDGVLNPRSIDKRRYDSGNPLAKVLVNLVLVESRTCRYTETVQDVGTFGERFVRSDRQHRRFSPENTQKLRPSRGWLEP